MYHQRRDYTGSVISVRNQAQVTLLECELKGQLSDGNWENSSPRDHWEQPCAAEVVIGTDKFGPNFYPRRAYNFANKDLLEVVQDRMIRAVRFVAAGYAIEDVHHGLSDVTPGEFTYQGEYWDKKRARYAALGIKSMDDYNAILATLPEYTPAQLRKDLKQMSADYNQARKG